MFILQGIGKSGSVQEGAGPAGRGARTEANASKKKVAGEVRTGRRVLKTMADARLSDVQEIPFVDIHTVHS